ncbi:MAG: winged helix-turn-helix domain-containing protein [Cyanobacteria bacterium P01_C01_bin.72]
MIEINIISATPGISTQERVLKLVQARKTGITIKEIKRILNRPISMIQIHLQELIAAKAIVTHKNKAGVGLIYYPSKNNLKN